MKYQKSRLYKTHEVLSFETPVKTGKVHDTSTGIILFQDGTLCIPYGYSWDGASGPALDTDNIMAPSLVHDALYELIRDGGLPISWRRTIDEHLYNMCRERGMWWIRAQWIKLALRWFGNRSARKSSKVYEAP